MYYITVYTPTFNIIIHFYALVDNSIMQYPTNYEYFNIQLFI